MQSKLKNMKLLLTDITESIESLLAKEVGEAAVQVYTNAAATYMISAPLPSSSSEFEYQKLAGLSAVVRFTTLDKGITIYTAIANFLVWLGQTYMKSGKLKVNFLDWGKIVGKVFILVKDIIVTLKKEKEVTDAVLSTKS